VARRTRATWSRQQQIDRIARQMSSLEKYRARAHFMQAQRGAAGIFPRRGWEQ